jgi:hypothetical protein
MSGVPGQGGQSDDGDDAGQAQNLVNAMQGVMSSGTAFSSMAPDGRLCAKRPAVDAWRQALAATRRAGCAGIQARCGSGARGAGEFGAASPGVEAATGRWAPASTIDVPRMPTGMQALRSAAKPRQIATFTRAPVGQ